MENYNLCSLFSGCGGLDIGFLLYNEDLKKLKKKKLFQILWANDFYRPACESYEKNFPVELYLEPDEPYVGKDRIFYGDVRIVDFKKAVGKNKIDLILGGFPCQDFSILRGNRDNMGIRVKRGRLYLEFVRSLYILRPKIFVAENVPGLVSANKGLAYKTILDDFRNLTNSWNEIISEYEILNKNIIAEKENLKYNILFSNVIDFSKIGVPQRRKRLIIIGLRIDIAKKFESRKLLRNLIKSIENFLLGEESFFKEYPLTPLETFEGIPINHLNHKYQNIMKDYEDSIKEIKSIRKNFYLENIWKKLTFDIKKDYLILNKIKSNNSGKFKILTIEKWMKTEEESFKKENKQINHWNKLLIKHKQILEELGYFQKPLNSIKFEDKSQDIFSEQPHVVERMSHIPPYENHEFVKDTSYHVTGLVSNVYRRLHPIFPAYTTIGKGGGGTWGYHYEKSRQRLTHRERARIQTFPDNFQFCGKSSEIRAQIGNAVPPLAGKRIAKIIYQILEKTEEITDS